MSTLPKLFRESSSRHPLCLKQTAISSFGEFVLAEDYDISDCEIPSDTESEEMLLSEFEIESECDSQSDSESTSDDMSICHLLQQLSQCDENLLFRKHGLKNVERIKNTAQGEIFHGLTSTDARVQIKKIDKVCHQDRTSLEDEDETQYIMDENIMDEQTILTYLLNENAPNHTMSQSICKPVSFFQSESDYYLVTELPAMSMSLKEFCSQAHEYIKHGQLGCKSYRKVMKEIFFQVSAVMHWLHSDMKCCHLNLTMDNIILQNADFFQKSNKSVTINPGITVKLADFSKAELFKSEDFSCDTFSYLHAMEQSIYYSPERINEQTFDARAADQWSIGMILYECMAGQPIYTSEDVSPLDMTRMSKKNGFWAVMSENIVNYLGMYQLLTHAHMSPQILSVITELLRVDENKRMDCKQFIKSKWLSGLYKGASEIQCIGIDNMKLKCHCHFAYL